MRVGEPRDDGRADLVDVLLHRLARSLSIAGREGVEDGQVLLHHIPVLDPGRGFPVYIIRSGRRSQAFDAHAPHSEPHA